MSPKECASDFIKSGRMCGGCHFQHKCGILDKNAKFLAKFLSDVDPDGLNITKIILRPIGT